jgi:hypothetical protein
MGSPQPQFEATHCIDVPVFFSISAFSELA